MRARGLMAAVLGGVLVASALLTSCAGSVLANGQPCPWAVASTRPREPNDKPVSLTVLYARTSDGQREFPGPDSMRLIDRVDEAHHPTVVLRDLRKGSEGPIIDTWSFRPEWSPDGRMIACIAWRSPQRQRQMLIVDWRRAKSIEIDSLLYVTDYRWAPDSRSIAVYGSDRVTGESILLVANPLTGFSRRIDRTSAYADFDYDWSPDGRMLAYTKPTRTSEHDVVLESDLWIANSSGKTKCCVLGSTDHVEQRPIWVGPHSLAILSAPLVDGEPRDPRDVVLEIKDTSLQGAARTTPPR